MASRSRSKALGLTDIETDLFNRRSSLFFSQAIEIYDRYERPRVEARFLRLRHLVNQIKIPFTVSTRHAPYSHCTFPLTRPTRAAHIRLPESKCSHTAELGCV